MKAVLKGIVTRSSRLSNLDDTPLDHGQKIYSIKSLGTGKDLTDEQLAAINTYARKPLTKDQVCYVPLLMAHNGIDRDVERFSEPFLDELAESLPGKGFFVEGHPGGWTGSGGPGEGLHFACRVDQMSPAEFKAKTGEDIKLPDGITTVHALMSDAYILALPSNADTRAKIDAGIIRFSSIGFKGPLYSITDDNGNNIYGEYRPKGEALEGSLVWLGAQPGAGVQKGAKGGKDATGPGPMCGTCSCKACPGGECSACLMNPGKDAAAGSVAGPMCATCSCKDCPGAECAACAKNPTKTVKHYNQFGKEPPKAADNTDQNLDHETIKGGMKRMKILAERLSKKTGKAFTAEGLGDELETFLDEMNAENASLKAKAADGDAYRDILVEDTIHYGAMIGEYATTEAAQRKEAEFIKTWPLTRIKFLKDKHEQTARKMYPDRFTIQGKEQMDRERSMREADRKHAQFGSKRDLTVGSNNPLLQV